MIGVIAILFACVPFLWWYLVLRKYSSTNVIPGPTPAPVIGNVIQLGDTPQQFLKNLLKYRTQHGTIFKVYVGGALRILMSSPELMEQVMSSNVHITKSDAYDLLKPWLGVGLLISTGQKWKSRRRMITPTFHFKILDQFIEVYNSCGDILVKKLSSEVGKKSVDVYPLVNLYSLDVICETSMGVKVNAQKGQNTKYVQAVDTYLKIFMIRNFSAWKRFNLLFRLSSMYASYEESLNILHDFTNTVIRKRREEKSKDPLITNVSDEGIKRRVALLDMLLESEETYNLSNEDIREEIDTFMFEGHDTTTSGIAFAILCLAENLDVQENVYEEIVSVIGEETDITLTMQHLQETKYLEMVVKEAQRMYPSVPIFERLLEQDSIIGDYKLPKDLFLTMFVYAMHHDEKYYPNPEKFDPNRFLPENQAKRHNYAYVPFSAGPRNCIGQKFAMLEMKATIIKIIRNFRILPIPGFKPDLGISGVLKSYNGVCVRLEPRHTI